MLGFRKAKGAKELAKLKRAAVLSGVLCGFPRLVASCSLLHRGSIRIARRSSSDLGSIRREVLSHLVFFGTKHLDSVAATWLEHYHGERPHQGKGNELLLRLRRKKPNDTTEPKPSLADVHCTKRLEVLLKSYSHRAAA